MEADEQHNVEVVRRYFDGCKNGELDGSVPTLARDVIHYFLPESYDTIRGSEHLARFWRSFKRTLDPTWHIDQIIGAGDVVVSEWSCRWRAPGTAQWVMSRGTEWYVMRDGLITEVRAYFDDGIADSEMADFPYVERGYLPSV
jgi:ketosteroid isomerase-like protein